MAARYTLWIVSPPDLVWSHVFDEVAISLQSAFKALSYEVDIVTDPKQIQGTAIILGANLAPMYGIKLPEDCIIFNLEQAHPDSRWFKPDYGYLDLLKYYPVWDFSAVNSAALKQMGVEDIVHCRIGYAPELTHILRKKEDIDVLFVGGGDPRRQVVFDEITKRGARFHQVFKQFGKERDDWIARGKIHLNLHKEPARLFEIVRVSYLLANGCFVISESGADPELENAFKDGMVFCDYDKLAETCLQYLVKPKERKRIAEAGFELIKTMPQKTFLANALEDHQRIHGKKKSKKTSEAMRFPDHGKSRIFVAVGSYRDPELQPTLADLFAKARYPDRLSVGLCLQLDAEMDKGCDVDLPQYAGQIRIDRYDWKESGGANWARGKALQFLGKEDYVLLIDSHMRFKEGWDETLIDMLQRSGADKPVLSAYCPNYDPPDKLALEPGFLLRMRVREIVAVDGARLVSLSGKHIATNSADERLGLYPTPFGIANCLFARASTLREVPLDPHIHFWGDEMNYSARLWTHGYDIFQLDQVVMYHCWVRKEMFSVQRYRPHKTPENLRSLARINHLLGFAQTKDEAALTDIGYYGLGNARRLEDLWAFAGLDWQKKKYRRVRRKGFGI